MDAVEETIAETPQNIVKPAKTFFITSANAAELRKKALLAKKAKELAMKQRIEQLEAESALARPLLEQAIAQAVAPTTEPESEYRLFRLQRTREQLLALDKQLEACSDPKLVKSLADAIARLCDVEQKLAMRPLPGSRRPGRESTSKAPSSFEPSE